MTALCESLRQTANRVRGWSYSGDADPDPRILMRDAANEIERLTSAPRDEKAALLRLHIAAENFYRGRGYLDAFRLKCALNSTRKIARDE